MSRLIIKDDFGKKLSLKKFKNEYEEKLLKKTIPRSCLITKKIMTPSQIDGFIKKGKLHKIKYRNKLYFSRREVGKCIKNQSMENIKNLTQIDLDKILREYKDLVVQTFQIGYIRDFVKEYRHKRAEKFKSYNIFNTTTHVALENFYLLLLWKLFDEKRSKMSVYGVSNIVKDQQFKDFFDKEIKQINREVDILNQWRNRIICHRDITVHFNSRHLENKFPLTDEGIKKLKDFLFEFLCQLDFSLHRTKIEELKNKYQKELDSLKTFCFKETQLILKDFPIKIKNSE